MTSCLSSNNEKSYEQRTAWVYLINLGFYFIPLYFMGGQWLKITIAIGLLVPFIIGYFWAYNSSKEQALKPIGLMFFTAIASSFVSSGAISLFSFCCFFVGFFYSLRHCYIEFYRTEYFAFSHRYQHGLLRLLFYFLWYGNLLRCRSVWCD